MGFNRLFCLIDNNLKCSSIPYKSLDYIAHFGASIMSGDNLERILLRHYIVQMRDCIDG